MVNQREGWEVFAPTADYVPARPARSYSCSWQILSSQIFPEISPLSFRATLGERGLTQADVSFRAFSVRWPSFCGLI